ncbi:Uma2 family endonuclease [Okeania hirsuta]|uniref:Uma2 family endonuclease n=1 Tax=Okeania hirsuta TaxID=1458930 RepID=UPI00249E2C98|nr:Uma2 family endonuclease [Okeania hirsuta]
MAEVASSSASYDLGEKLKVYRCNQVQEYLVWQVYEQKIDWFRWREGEYINLSIDEQGIIKSEIFPGLWLSVSNLISGNLVEVNSELQKGLKTSEHQKFLAQLNK